MNELMWLILNVFYFGVYLVSFKISMLLKVIFIIM